ncbi:udp-Glucose/Gdp-Mannose dehydrogenase [Arthrobacter sp. Hiyo8]|nr:udp-Glucose/Gdp-Mannose dehydrogenase [Arthrobacter sp. Hiyo8]
MAPNTKVKTLKAEPNGSSQSLHTQAPAWPEGAGTRTTTQDQAFTFDVAIVGMAMWACPRRSPSTLPVGVSSALTCPTPAWP